MCLHSLPRDGVRLDHFTNGTELTRLSIIKNGLVSSATPALFFMDDIDRRRTVSPLRTRSYHRAGYLLYKTSELPIACNAHQRMLQVNGTSADTWMVIEACKGDGHVFNRSPGSCLALDCNISTCGSRESLQSSSGSSLAGMTAIPSVVIVRTPRRMRRGIPFDAQARETVNSPVVTIY